MKNVALQANPAETVGEVMSAEGLVKSIQNYFGNGSCFPHEPATEMIEQRDEAIRQSERAKWSEEHVRVVNAAYVIGKEEERTKARELVKAAEVARSVLILHTRSEIIEERAGVKKAIRLLSTALTYFTSSNAPEASGANEGV